MDPYLILKIRRDCTRTEVKEIFRAKVQLDHPDHGGDKKQFIKICTAYRMILSDLDALAKIESSSRSANDAKCSESTASRSADDPYVKLLRKVSARSNAGKSQRRQRRRTSRQQARIGRAILGGLLALGFFLAEIVVPLYVDGPRRRCANPRPQLRSTRSHHSSRSRSAELKAEPSRSESALRRSSREQI